MIHILLSPFPALALHTVRRHRLHVVGIRRWPVIDVRELLQRTVFLEDGANLPQTAANSRKRAVDGHDALFAESIMVVDFELDAVIGAEALDNVPSLPDHRR